MAVHVIGAGLAGLSAAVTLANAGQRVILYEASGFAGGRCRSYYDTVIDLTIDNGNHLLLSGNWAALDYLRLVGGMDAMAVAERPEFRFADVVTGERWTLRPNEGRLPWWVLAARRRVPGTRAPDYLAPIGVLRAPPSATVGAAMACSGLLYERLWRPVLLAALNTEPEHADARLAARVLKETLGAGGHACKPLVATGGLSAAFVDPALRFLRERGAEICLGKSLRRITYAGGQLGELDFGQTRVVLEAEDKAILAVPPVVATALVPGITAPQIFHAIVNIHFRVAPPPGQPLLTGVLNGLTEWLFAYPDRLSVTISCADRLMEESREKLAESIWREVSLLIGLPPDLPRWQMVRERRATFAATPQEAARRPGTRTRYPNLFLAGDWTDTGLPATIEGAVRSGRAAAAAVTEGRGRLEPARKAA
jgi:squalene-associated FAD-dependent desaturase